MTMDIPSPDDAVPPVRPAAPAGATRVAAFTCRGLEALSRDLGFRVAVVAAVQDVDRHRERLRSLWYASGVAKSYAEWFDPFDFDDWHYRDWSRVPIDRRWFGPTHHALAGCVDDGDLLIRLPAGVAPRAFSDAFTDRLADLRFEAVARRPASLVRRHHGRRPVAVASRYARASATSMAAVEVRDLVWFAPRTLRSVADAALAALRASVERAGGGPAMAPLAVVAP